MEEPEARRLYRSERERMVAGVCGGLGDYLKVDPTVVRVVFVLLAFVSGLGVALYLAMWVLVPAESQLDAAPPATARAGVADMRERARQGAREARRAVERLRGGRRGTGGYSPGPQGGTAQEPPGWPPPSPGPQAPGWPPPSPGPQAPGGPPGEERDPGTG